jgi:L-threonylcarbamoyladenylate synthase
MDEEVRKAAGIVLSGGTILYPTDTIWGIGCDATSEAAVEQVYRIKQRSDNLNMLVLVSGLHMLGKYVDKIPGAALDIIRTASRPTTIIYPGAINLAMNLIAEDGSIGIRVTSDPFCQELINMTGVPLVSTSANISGQPSPDTFQAIEPLILELVDHVVDWRQDDTTPAHPSSLIKVDEQGLITLLRN